MTDATTIAKMKVEDEEEDKDEGDQEEEEPVVRNRKIYRVPTASQATTARGQATEAEKNLVHLHMHQHYDNIIEVATDGQTRQYDLLYPAEWNLRTRTYLFDLLRTKCGFIVYGSTSQRVHTVTICWM